MHDVEKAILNADKYTIGIDPGQSGGIAVLHGAELISLRRMPETERDIWNLVDNLPHGIVYMEKVGARPAFGGSLCPLCHRPTKTVQGIASTFKFGMNYGFIRGCVVASELPLVDVIPTVWMRGVGFPAVKHEKSTDRKRRLKSLAQQLFPDVHITLKTCDAVLIAKYGLLQS